jgi:hypothetical protein
MGTKLNQMMADAGKAPRYTDEYLTFMSSHFKFIREHQTTVKAELDKKLVHKNVNDFYGLFMDMGVRYEDHQLLLLINGYKDPFELTEEVETLLFPAGQLIDSLKLLFKTTEI